STSGPQALRYTARIPPEFPADHASHARPRSPFSPCHRADCGRLGTDAVHGGAAWLWILAATDFTGPWLDTRNLFAGDGLAEPAVGSVRPVCRHGRRPFRHRARRVRRRIPV